jgi:hypothetical protein
MPALSIRGLFDPRQYLLFMRIITQNLALMAALCFELWISGIGHPQLDWA